MKRLKLLLQAFGIALMLIAMLDSNIDIIEKTYASGTHYLPYPAGVSYMVYGDNTSSNHTSEGLAFYNKYAFDFAMPVGSTVVATRGGTVSAIKEDSSTGGCVYDLHPYANYVIIDHGDGTSSFYLHLDANSVNVNAGDTVITGQPIAKSGQTGYTCGPHLHYTLRNSSTGESIPSTFSDPDVLRQNSNGVPTYPNYYISGNFYAPSKPCVLPSTHFVPASSCSITGHFPVNGVVQVKDGITLTIENNGHLDINLVTWHLKVDAGGTVIVKPGGKIS